MIGWKNTKQRSALAFTLIELLLVLSIIAILAIIATPNFGEAQTRSKVAVVKSNLRNVAIKFEMLGVESNRYPLAGKWRWLMLYRIPFWLENRDDVRPPFLRAYERMYGPHEDVFEQRVIQRTDALDGEWLPVQNGSYLCHGFNFFHPQMMIDAIDYGCKWEDYEIENWRVLNDLAGGWILFSPGPDLHTQTPGWLSIPGAGTHYTGQTGYREKLLFHEYDPTNGTVSYGNIFRTQKNQSGLGTHSHFNL